ncbi:MAG: FecR family protein [Myxococcota bacterium]
MNKNDLKTLGIHLRSARDRDRPAFDRKAGLHRFLAAANTTAQKDSKRQQSRRLRMWMATSALTATAVLGIVFLASPRSTPSVSAPATFKALDKHRVLWFDDGTSIRLKTGTELRVKTIDNVGATVELRHGEILFAGRHTPHNRWRLISGNYDVRVRGTRFRLEWSPKSARFMIDIEEGQVDVRTPQTEKIFRLGAGDRFVRPTPVESTVAPESAGTPDSAAITESAVTPEPPAPAPRANRKIPERRSTRSPKEPVSKATLRQLDGATLPKRRRSTKPISDWKPLVAQRAYLEAVSAAEAQGLATICSSEPPALLMELVDAARYARRFAAAIKLLKCIRTYHDEAVVEAPLAAYLLGTIAVERRRAARARRWFAQYLSEAPHGPLAEQAMGQLIILDGPEVRHWAQRYLRQYPNGAHADHARKYLSR